MANFKDFILKEEDMSAVEEPQTKKKRVPVQATYTLLTREGADFVVQKETKTTKEILAIIPSQNQFYVQNTKSKKINYSPKSMASFFGSEEVFNQPDLWLKNMTNKPQIWKYLLNMMKSEAVRKFICKGMLTVDIMNESRGEYNEYYERIPYELMKKIFDIVSEMYSHEIAVRALSYILNSGNYRGGYTADLKPVDIGVRLIQYFDIIRCGFDTPIFLKDDRLYKAELIFGHFGSLQKIEELIGIDKTERYIRQWLSASHFYSIPCNSANLEYIHEPGWIDFATTEISFADYSIEGDDNGTLFERLSTYRDYRKLYYENNKDKDSHMTELKTTCIRTWNMTEILSDPFPKDLMARINKLVALENEINILNKADEYTEFAKTLADWDFDYEDYHIQFARTGEELQYVLERFPGVEYNLQTTFRISTYMDSIVYKDTFPVAIIEHRMRNGIPSDPYAIINVRGERNYSRSDRSSQNKKLKECIIQYQLFADSKYRDLTK